jgi:predicted lipoprotein with Yx(FWY)xxD motif
MKKLLILAGIVAALALAACGGGGDDSSDSAAAMAPATTNDTVAIKDIGDTGRVLVDSNGQALYTSDKEAGGAVMCTGGCESFWMPLTMNGKSPTGSVTGKLGVVKRPDGTNQVTYNGTPLYSFTQEGPGEVTGNGVSDAFGGRKFTWSVVTVGGGTSSSDTSSSGSGGYGY